MIYKKLVLVLPFIYACLSSTAIANEYDSDTTQAIESSAKVEENNVMQNQENSTYALNEDRSAVSITGFYCGVNAGVDVLKNKFLRDKDYVSAGNDEAKKSEAKKKKTKAGFSGDIFAGYNFQMDKFLFGLECSIGMMTSKNSTEIGTDIKNDVNVKRKYSFGIAPRIGYNITGGLHGYVNLGTSLAKYKVNSKEKSTSKESKKSPTKASMFIGVGVEQTFGSLFVRGECNKIFRKTIAVVEGTKVSGDSYIFKVGGGYRF